ncbi:MAG: aminopeptidase P N-terminal domain-containing protein [Verrucomicrobia bacterium]|nr:aminopeptidase P N-terminal domain-containing protein [Verrucomicrobiota bacterium]|tara:strand:- start:70397 stop:71683 length:1287 start_codon:yes stop_codon:yes gene_type:complete
MRTQLPDPSLFKTNRANLAALLAPNSIAVIHSNDIYPSNVDAQLPFEQNSDLFYLTGVDQEDTILILHPDAKDPKDREILFVRESNDTIAVWEGAKLTKQQASERTGITRIDWNDTFEVTLGVLAVQADNIYITTNEHPHGYVPIEPRNARFVKQCKKRFPLHRYERLAPLIYKLRTIKADEEITFIQQACDITEAGFRRVLGFLKPGVGEWQVQAEYIHEFTRSGSRGFAYPPILAGGSNACVLHYVENNCELKDGDLMLMDVAAEYGGWNSDMTRTIPVNGKFTDRQRDVYNAVLRMLHFADSILRPGILMPEFQKQVIAQMEKELIDLGLFTTEEAAAQDDTKPLVKKYFMHGTSHHIGIDVHDVSPAHTAVAPGMVFTIEPGIYIQAEKLGVRLENDYLIGETENINLMATIPIEADEIEALMA